MQTPHRTPEDAGIGSPRVIEPPKKKDLKTIPHTPCLISSKSNPHKKVLGNYSTQPCGSRKKRGKKKTQLQQFTKKKQTFMSMKNTGSVPTQKSGIISSENTERMWEH